MEVLTANSLHEVNHFWNFYRNSVIFSPLLPCFSHLVITGMSLLFIEVK